ncbi:hypothetical protein BDZ85DRAFT_260301 [Elsinoe ampelina]|uniref:DUF1776-domain-containing protein n=1 Tax=Elsinoe ampelina TaxID=302913 RepID=A0A6A6GE96_9PEZI|nr:hypothetical protein BDZ85DRAFT_260301 [Elsinoe ampelina]
MTDAQYLFDLAARQYNETAEVIERHFETVADQIRELIPKRTPFSAPPPPPRRLPPAAYFHNLQTWALRHKAITAGLAAFFGTGAVYLLFQRYAYKQRRRAKRTANGARTEVVVLAGSAVSPLTTALALDLERRGYIVYVVTNSPEDIQHVRDQKRVDIVPLNLDLVYPEIARDQVHRIHDLLSRHHYPIEGEQGHRLSLAGVIMIPDAQFQTGSIAEVTPETWSYSLNAKVLNTIVTTQHLLPLITDFQSRVLLLTPGIIPSLNPPNHAIQSTIAGALQGFSASLAAELRPAGIPMTHFKLGHLELPGSQAKVADGKKRVKGTPLRRLHDNVFDALQASRPWRTYHVGKGSLTYDIIGSWLPSGVVGWMIGLSSQPTPQQSEPRFIEMSDSGSEGASAQWERVDDTEQVSA